MKCVTQVSNLALPSPLGYDIIFLGIYLHWFSGLLQLWERQQLLYSFSGLILLFVVIVGARNQAPVQTYTRTQLSRARLLPSRGCFLLAARLLPLSPPSRRAARGRNQPENLS